MNAPLRPAWLTRPAADPSVDQHAADAPAAPLVERQLWHSRFGTIVVEVREGEVYVNGEWVRPAEPEG